MYKNPRLKIKSSRAPFCFVDLNYPPAVIKRMWAVTQGHPALLQMLCRYMVNLANTETRKDMTLADLEQVITQKIVQR
ncbi:MAG: hypothetical protein DRQ57_19185 [Gammaproteobacteria bacterium]|nr:MAG: hypothetical protein DRQ57_19185 [Gammaproteobacteria bacterium]